MFVSYIKINLTTKTFFFSTKSPATAVDFYSLTVFGDFGKIITYNKDGINKLGKSVHDEKRGEFK